MLAFFGFDVQGYATPLPPAPGKKKFKYSILKTAEPRIPHIVAAISSVCTWPIEEPGEEMQDTHD